MTDGDERSRLLADDAVRLRRQAQALAERREQLGAALTRTAGDIARTEARIADTLDQVADGRPEDAERLHRHAQAAREFAAREAVFGRRQHS